jgi:hypothetical protein
MAWEWARFTFFIQIFHILNIWLPYIFFLLYQLFRHKNNNLPGQVIILIVVLLINYFYAKRIPVNNSYDLMTIIMVILLAGMGCLTSLSISNHFISNTLKNRRLIIHCPIPMLI